MPRPRRHAGLIVPLFSLRSAADWGIGEIPDLAGLAAWLAAAGQAAIHTLPILERAPGERSPYGALSAFAIDPVHLGIDALEDFAAAGGRAALAPEDRDAIGALRAEPGIAYDRLRALKVRALERAFAAFQRHHGAGDTQRARVFERFRHEAAEWLEDYVLYRALREEGGDAPWTAWPAELAGRDPGALARAAARLRPRRCYHAWVQWVAHEQWAAARAAAGRLGVRVVGDAPFMVACDSADVWARPHEFDTTVSIGAPPDAFDADGQDWALPAYRWAEIRAGRHAWLRARLRAADRMLDGLRLDHIVGYFRTWVRSDEEAGFDPRDEDEQRALGAMALDAVLEARGSLAIIAEDLGSVPDFVREALAARGLPGYRVLRWETDDGVFRDPRAFPACSVATTGTHDTSTLAAWWRDEIDDEGRVRLATLPPFVGLPADGGDLSPAAHRALVAGLYAAGSDAAVMLFEDVHGGTERINRPATVGPHNWAYRLPWSVEELAQAPARERALWLRDLAVQSGRAD